MIPSGSNVPATDTIHATCVVTGAAGVLIRGPSGAGKSVLALALVSAAREAGHFAALVGDDRVSLQARHGRLVARVPPPIAGLMELRGAGLLETDCLAAAIVRLVVDLVPSATIERLPEREALRVSLAGIDLARQPVPERDATLALPLVNAALRSL